MKAIRLSGQRNNGYIFCAILIIIKIFMEEALCALVQPSS
jgi:hypothetical protein